MTEEELKKILNPHSEPTLIMASEMKDVAFWPLSIAVTDTHYELNGLWYSNVLADVLGNINGEPLRETIKILKKDLSKWTEKKLDHTQI